MHQTAAKKKSYNSANYFITATDTDAGKTYVTALLTKSLRKAGLNTVAIKPVAAGSMNDSEMLRAAGDYQLSLEQITPIFYQAPLAPLHAAPLEKRNFSCQEILPLIHKLKSEYPSLLIEGVGGWLVPFSPTESLPDLVQGIEFPVILVVRNRLGAINHTLLTLESIKHHGASCVGIILNHHPLDQNDFAIPEYRIFFQQLAQQLKLSLFLEVEPNQEEIPIEQLSSVVTTA